MKKLISLGLILAAQLAFSQANYVGKLTALPGSNTATNNQPAVNFGSVNSTNFNGNGANITNLNSANLAGTVADDRLSTNVALLNGSVWAAYLTTALYGSGWGGLPTNIFSGYLPASTYNNNWGAIPTNALGGSLPTTNASLLVTGTLPDARLSGNVPLLNSGSLSFTGSITASSFIGTASGLTSITASNLAPGSQIPIGTLFDYRTNDPSGLVYMLWADAVTGQRHATVDAHSLTNLTAANLTGTVPDSALSTNVAEVTNLQIKLYSSTAFLASSYDSSSNAGGLYMLVGNDPLAMKSTSIKPAYSDPNGNYIRDPSQCYYQGKYWLFYTTMGPGNNFNYGTNVGVASSMDDLNWTFVGYMNFTNPASSTSRFLVEWAPEPFINPTNGLLELFVNCDTNISSYASNLAVYVSEANPSTLTYTNIRKVTGLATGSDDAFVLTNNGLYYLFAQSAPSNSIYEYVSPNMDSGYTTIYGSTYHEGSCVMPYHGGSGWVWITANSAYIFSQDLTNWSSPWVSSIIRDAYYDQGTVLQITNLTAAIDLTAGALSRPVSELYRPCIMSDTNRWGNPATATLYMGSMGYANAVSGGCPVLQYVYSSGAAVNGLNVGPYGKLTALFINENGLARFGWSLVCTNINGNASVANMTVTNAPTLVSTNAAPLNAITPVLWFPVTNNGAVYLVPGYQ